MFRTWFICWLLAVPTLGLSLLWFSAYRMRYFAECMRFENLRFALPIRFGDLFRIVVPYFVLVMVLSAAVGFLFFDAARAATAAANGGQPDFSAVGPQLVTAGIVYVVLFFIVIPVAGAVMVTHRWLDLYCSRLSIIGNPDFAAVAQSTHQAPGVGEGLADALGIGGI